MSDFFYYGDELLESWFSNFWVLEISAGASTDLVYNFDPWMARQDEAEASAEPPAEASDESADDSYEPPHGQRAHLTFSRSVCPR